MRTPVILGIGCVIGMTAVSIDSAWRALAFAALMGFAVGLLDSSLTLRKQGK